VASVTAGEATKLKVNGVRSSSTISWQATDGMKRDHAAQCCPARLCRGAKAV
jgi:hypothetical protein